MLLTNHGPFLPRRGEAQPRADEVMWGRIKNDQSNGEGEPVPLAPSTSALGKKNKHDIGDQKPGLCTTCGKTYKTRTYLWDHVYRVHMKRRKGQRNHFPRDSEEAQAMRREMAKHMGTL